MGRMLFAALLLTSFLAHSANADNCCQYPGVPRTCSTESQKDCATNGGTWYANKTCNTQTGTGVCEANVPAVSEWGLMFLVLLLGTAGLVLSRERNRGATGQ